MFSQNASLFPFKLLFLSSKFSSWKSNKNCKLEDYLIMNSYLLLRNLNVNEVLSHKNIWMDLLLGTAHTGVITQ